MSGLGQKGLGQKGLGQKGLAQLGLKFPLSPRLHFSTFEPGGNAELVQRLEALPAAEGFAGCYLYGAPGVGRTHLLQAACHAGGPNALYLPLGELEPRHELLDGLEALALVALDDIDGWLGNAEAERALLGLYQGLHVAGGRLAVSGSAAPASLECHFADLASRLRGLPTYHLRPLDDDAKARVLARLAAERGLRLDPAVADFWLTRRERNLASLVADLERLDEAAMAAQKRLTVPLLKSVLGL